GEVRREAYFAVDYSYRRAGYGARDSGRLIAPSRSRLRWLLPNGQVQLGVLQHFGLLEGVDHAVDHGDVGEHRDHPQHRRHAIEQGADDDQHDALRTLQEANFALGNGVLRASPRIADHHRPHHDDGGEHDVEEAIDAGVVDQQADVQRQVRVTVQHGIEEAAEARHLAG